MIEGYFPTMQKDRNLKTSVLPWQTLHPQVWISQLNILNKNTSFARLKLWKDRKSKKQTKKELFAQSKHYKTYDMKYF